jgi:hypothetical protein
MDAGRDRATRNFPRDLKAMPENGGESIEVRRWARL